MGETVLDEDMIELDVPLDNIGDHISSLFAGSEFITERQKLEIVSFDYTEDTRVFHFVLKVVSERSH